MNIDQLKDFCFLTAQRSVLNKHRYRYLVLDPKRLAEADVRHVMAQILTENKQYFALEYPTVKKQKKTNHEQNHVGLVDMAIFEKGKPVIYVEFKRAQPTPDRIAKDFRKMIKDGYGTEGSCFFHILPASANGRNTEKARREIVNKYEAVYQKARKGKRAKCWFLLFILDCKNEDAYIYSTPNIRECTGLTKQDWTPLKGKQALKEAA